MFAQIKMYLAIAVVVALAALFGYMGYQMYSLRHQVDTAAQTIIQQKADIDKLGDANDSLKASNDRRVQEALDAAAQLAADQQADAERRTKLDQLNSYITDPKRLEREQKIRADVQPATPAQPATPTSPAVPAKPAGKASLLLEIANANVRCQVAHFAQAGGRCVADRWTTRSLSDR